MTRSPATSRGDGSGTAAQHLQRRVREEVRPEVLAELTDAGLGHLQRNPLHRTEPGRPQTVLVDLAAGAVLTMVIG